MKIALSNMNSRIGALELNAQAILDSARDADGVDVLVTPELAMSGYPPRDLLFREGFVDRCERTVRMLAAKLPPEMLVLVGTPRRSSNGDPVSYTHLTLPTTPYV